MLIQSVKARRALAGLLATLGGAAAMLACQRGNAERPAAGPGGEVTIVEAREAAGSAPLEPAGNGRPESIAKHAEGESSEASVRFTEAEARTIHAQLLERLRASQLEHRDALLASSTPFSLHEDPDGGVRLSGWILARDGASGRLAQRVAESAGGLLVYYAPLEKVDGAWKVGAIAYSFVHRRR